MSGEAGVPKQFARPGFSHSRAMGALLIVLYVAGVLLPLAAAWRSSPRTGMALLVELGKSAALIALAILTLQVVLAGRFRLADRPFGLDMVMEFHKCMAVLALLLLLAHPTLFMISYGNTNLLGLDIGWPVNVGKLALLVLLVTVLFALTFKLLHVSYQVWRFLHKGAILVVLLGFTHGWLVADDFAAKGVMACVSGLLLVAAGVYLYRNVYVPLWGRRRFRVVSVKPETVNTWTLTMQPEDGAIGEYHPGQFMFLQVKGKGVRAEQHPFTIASAPTQEGAITATIKESGDFTKTIGRVQPRDVALVEAPFGRFSFVHHDVKRFLFIAGGVGITPVMSMLRFLRDTRDARPATLLYNSRTERDVVFRDELAQMPPNVKAVHVLSKPDEQWPGVRGNLTADVIRQHAGGGLNEADVYLCGPPPMIRKVLGELQSLGVSARRIHYERFSL